MSDDITKLREMLFETMRDLRAGTLDTDRARVINDSAQTIINSAKVEVDYIKATGAQTSNGFIDGTAKSDGLPPGIVSVRQHRLLG
jgi:hypothetical protein